MNAVLTKLSRTDKLRVMEELWNDLTAKPKTHTSPSWHLDELKKTEQAIESEQVKFMDWEKAKQSIRQATLRPFHV